MRCLLGAGFALLIISYIDKSYYAKAVTITNGVYTMLYAVFISQTLQCKYETRYKPVIRAFLIKTVQGGIPVVKINLNS